MDELFTRCAERVLRLLQSSPASGSAARTPALPEPGFEELALDLFRIQVAAVPVYARYCAGRGIDPATVTSWRSIPALPVVAFKEFEVTSLAAGDRTRVFHSSGTTGTLPSRHFHDARSLALYEASALAWFHPHLLADFPTRARFLSLTPPPSEVPHSSLVHMLEIVRRSRTWAFAGYLGSCASTAAGWRLDGERAAGTLADAMDAGDPVLLVGTAFSFVDLLDWLAARGRAFRLPAGSRAMETGGYKGRSRSLPRNELHASIGRTLGIPPANVISEYGMSELSSQAYDRRIGSAGEVRRFRFPPWARTRIVSPETLAEAAIGETGLVEVVDLANVRSVLAIRTEDVAVRRDDGFDWVGRIPTAEPRGCSLLVSP